MRFNKRISIFLFLFMVFIAYASFAQDVGYPFTDKDRNPFSPLISTSGKILIPQDTTVSNFVLKGIVYSQEKALAIINDEVLKENDRVGDYIISKIEKKSVLLKKGDEGIVLKLEEE